MGVETRDPRIGHEFAGYRVEALIGRGGMGAVYRAEDMRLGRKVALKLLVPELAEDERFRERFLRESRLAAAIDHPNIVPIYQAGEIDGVLFIAMRYVEGEDLGHVLAETGALEPANAVAIVEQVAKALDAAHGRGLVHRDVKPGNILLVGDHYYLADFGLTKQASSISGLTGTGQLVGTVDYVSPEQVQGKPLDARSDEYALACVTYECLTATTPFERGSEVATLWAHVNDRAPRLSERRAELPRAFDAVLDKALAKDPKGRYASCSEFASALRRALPTAERPALTLRERMAQAPIRYELRRHRRIAAAIALALAAAVAVAVVLLTRSSGLSSVAPQSIGIIDPKSGKITGQIRLPEDPSGVGVGTGLVWVSTPQSHSVLEFDLDTRKAVQNVGLDIVPSPVAAADGAGWVVEPSPIGVVDRLVPRAPKPSASLSYPVPVKSGTTASVSCPPILPGSPSAGSSAVQPLVSVTYGGGSFWFVCSDGMLGALKPDDNRVRTSEYTGGGPSGLVYQDGDLWITNYTDGTVSKYNPAIDEIEDTISVGRGALGITAGAGSIWVTVAEGNSVARINPGTDNPVTIPVGRQPTAIAFANGAVWVANREDHTVSRIDPAKNAATKTIKLGARSIPVAIAAGDGRLWVAVQSPGPFD
jgi:serine/threonine protein kinase